MNTVDWAALLVSALAVLGTFLGTIWAFALWLNKQFAENRQVFYSQMEKLREAFIQKLEYHEKHDDQRFNSITNDLWEIRVRNASKDGNASPARKGIND